MRKPLFLLSLCVACAQLLVAAAQHPLESERARTRGSGIVGVHERHPERVVSLYGESHALVIGMSEYEHPHWGDLPGVKVDADEVSKVLVGHGFTVEHAMNLKGRALMARLEDFISRHGASEQNRLLIYYAGHGFRTQHGLSGREEGYIVPIDAPAPDKTDSDLFAATAISMSRFMACAVAIKSKHALLVLDSCFSGSLINAAQATLTQTAFAAARASASPPERLTFERAGQGADAQPYALPLIPYAISTNAEERAHRFITSGTDKQFVPDDSEFRRMFVRGLTDESGGGADMNGDSYVTGDEFGSYLYNNVAETRRGRQRPRHGFVSGQAANPGDFLFVLPGAYAREEMVGPSVAPALWALPPGWSFVKEKGKDRLLAQGPGIALPVNLVRHSFHDFTFVTRLRLTNNTAAGFVLRAQSPQDYYLIRITGNNVRGKNEKFTMRAFVVRNGQPSELAGSGLGIKHPDVEQRLNHEDLIKVEIVAEGNQFTVHLSAAEGNGAGFPLINPLKFTDEKQSFRYGAPGYLVQDTERFKIDLIHAARLPKKGKV